MAEELTPYKAKYWIDVTVDGERAITLEVDAADWGRADVYEAVLKPQIDEWAAYPGRTALEKAAVKRAVRYFCKQWTETPPKAVPRGGYEATYETELWGAETYGNLPVSEVPATWKGQLLSTAVYKEDPQKEVEVVSAVEELLWPIPDTVATINTTDPTVIPADECLWAQPELVAALWRLQRELESRSAGKPYSGNPEKKNKIAINSVYRRSGVTALDDEKGYKDRYGDEAGHWTGYTVDLGRLETARRFGLSGTQEERQEEVKKAAEAAGFEQKFEPWHFRVIEDYRFE